MIFAVVPLNANNKHIEAIRGKLKPLEQPIYDSLLPSILFLSFRGGTDDLAKVIGFGDDEAVGTGIVLRVTHYNGFASRSLWEWMDNHE